MVCVPCILVPLLLFLWGIIKPMLNWFRKPVENSGADNTEDDQVCSLLSSCPCINKNKKEADDPSAIKEESETLLTESVESKDDKKNL